ncbi:hypothetical protein XENORESO_013490, partial [Xenotaenia resolanae]
VFWEIAIELIGHLYLKEVTMGNEMDKKLNISGDLSGNTAKNASDNQRSRKDAHCCLLLCSTRSSLTEILFVFHKNCTQFFLIISGLQKERK